MCNPDTGTARFNPKTTTFEVTTPKGIFEDVACAGAFDNFREMDIEMWDLFADEIKEKGMMAYISTYPNDMYLFYYPERVGGGDITVYRKEDL